MLSANPSFALLLPLVLLLAGCPHRVDFGPAGLPVSADDLLKRIEVAESRVIGVKGEARLKLSSPQTNGSVTLFAAVSEPAFIHLEQLDFFGKPQGILISDGTTFGLYDGQAGKYFHGPATAQNVGRIVPIAVAPAELAALLLGRAPRIPHASAEMSVEADVLTLTLKNGGVTQTLTIATPSYRVARSTVTGMNAYDLEFDDIEDSGALTYPRRVVIASPRASLRLELNYKDVALNEPADLTLYEMTPPANVPSVEVDAAGNPREGSAP